jgi:hypothetical protein
MKLMGIRQGVSIFLLFTLISCNNKGFKGATASEEAPEPVAKDATAEMPPMPEMSSILEQSMIEVTSSQIQVAECREKLNYDPSQILCSLKQNDKKTIWDVTPPWTERVNLLKNRAASWISPLTPVENVNNASVMCPFVPDSDRLIFVSHFTLAEDAEIAIEAVIDDTGSLRLWKDADSRQQVYRSAEAPRIDGRIRLTKGFYSIVADGVDIGKAATGMIMTIFNAQGGIIRQTEASTKDWCIFRVKADTNVESFVNAASLCRPCMVGSRATAP